ncbi:TetR/AcrR family transcriptional regulator [Nocardia sp. AG03]|uniref:TetR/AcrR family transcriptional regulator n=1 Tax=Nocardia sp. AG03 TaxID=3025312 RepID=UPI00241835F0|nr:TetR/AcrR family transcriptional regulator [Nocardia sp. AG03]
MTTSGSTSPAGAFVETRTQRRAAANRRIVIDAAREIIAADGLEALTLEAVAERADVAVQTIYNRVGGRSALLTAVAERAMEENRVYMDAAYSAEGSVEERLLRAAAEYVRFARERPHEFRILANPPDEPQALERIVALTREQNGKLANILRDGIAVGTGRPDLDPDRVATALWASLNGLLALTWRTDSLRVDDTDMDTLVATFVATVSDGLRTRSPR